MSSSEEFNLHNLPQDVIREVIKLGVEHVDTMKMISPEWHELVEDHLRNRTNLPKIKRLIWRVDNVDDWKNGAVYVETTLSVYITKRFQKYFWLEEWEHDFITFDRSISTYRLKTNTQNSMSSEELKKFSNRLTRLFGRCSGIRRLDMPVTTGKTTTERDVIINAVSGMKINTLFCRRLPELHISQVLRANQVGRLVLLIAPFTEEDSKFEAGLLSSILNVSRLVAVIELSSRDPDEKHQAKNIKQEHKKSYEKICRFEWSKCATFLSQSEKITATLHEEYMSDEMLRFFISLTAKAS